LCDKKYFLTNIHVFIRLLSARTVFQQLAVSIIY